MTSKQELERAKKRLLDAIAASKPKVEVVNNDALKGNGISVSYQKRNYFFWLPSNSSGMRRNNQ